MRYDSIEICNDINHYENKQTMIFTSFSNSSERMSTKLALFFFLLFTLFFRTSFPAFLAPITKDFAKKRYTVSLYLKTPPQATNLLLDLSASFALVDCSSNYSSSTYHTVPCGSSRCNSLGYTDSGCSNDRCAFQIGNSETGEARVDMLYMQATNGRNPGRLTVIPEFLFSCAELSSLKGRLVKGATGSAGFGRSTLSLPAQVSTSALQNSTFALCLSGSPSAPGVAFIGTSGPYYFLPEIDLAQYLNYTPLLSNQLEGTVKSYSSPSNEYYINMTSVNVNGKALDFDRTILSIDKHGHGGTKLSTVVPYTRLQSTIFTALREVFVNESAALNLTVTTPVRPFNVCYKADDVMSVQTGPAVPTIDLVLHDENVIWRIFGGNSMVRVYNKDGVDVWCLGFLDAGLKPRTSIVIGGHQMEDNLLQFDLQSKRLGFTSSVLVQGTMCANFNFTNSNSL